MRRLEPSPRAIRLLDEAIERFELDLRGIAVLTEAASGPFVVTPLIAARAGASVVAVTRDSRHGAAAEVRALTLQWARALGVHAGLQVHVGDARDCAPGAQLITNLGFVRPLDAALLKRAGAGAVVSLMCEPWEVREQDVDVPACRRMGIPVLGTDERDPRVATFRYLGVLAVKLLLELELEVLRGEIIVISSEPFATPVVDALRALGATVTLLDVTAGADLLDDAAAEACGRADGVVVAEHRDRRVLLGGETGLPLAPLAAAGAVVAHIAGVIEDPEERLRKHPAGPVAPGWMAVTTDAVGPRPVIDLHTAGLRVGQSLVQAMRRLGDAGAAQAAALADSPALAPGGAA